jgi:hypothetical protein
MTRGWGFSGAAGQGGFFDEQPTQAARQVPSLTRISRAKDKERFIFKTPETRRPPCPHCANRAAFETN